MGARCIVQIRKNSKGAAAVTSLFSLAFLIVTGAGVITPLTTLQLQSAEAQRFIETGTDLGPTPNAPTVVSGDNIYIAWWTNNTENGDEEVMFKASTDGGQTFGDKINLSNSTDAESQTAEILAVGEDTVFVSWWETSAETGSSESVLRVSTDGGQTFGPMIMLGMNGTISTTAANGNTTGAAEAGEEAGEETVEEAEAVGEGAEE